MTPVSTAPVTTSTRSAGRSSVRSFLSTAYDWMNDSPHGASVVPRVAVTIAIDSLPVGMVGTSVPCTAAPQSGWASTPDTT